MGDGIEGGGEIEGTPSPTGGARNIGGNARAEEEEKEEARRRGTKALHGSSHQRVGLNRKP